MTTLDQFESVFKSAVKSVYQHQPVSINSAMLITDLSQNEANSFAAQVRQLLTSQQISNWQILHNEQYSTTSDLLDLAGSDDLDLICCYRNLCSEAWRHPHSLGSYLDVLIQRTATPVLVLPHPEAGYAWESAYSETRRVLAMTDHMTEDDRLVSYAAAFSSDQLFLAHIEDEGTFERYVDAISKITSIDTPSAAAAIRHELLKHPTDYIASCQAVLSDIFPGLAVDPIVAYGHKLTDYLSHVQERDINLLVMHGKQKDQLAMHGLSYPLAIELRQIPLLII